MKQKLADLLLRRKELQLNIDRIKPVLAQDNLFEVKAKRVSVTDSVDDMTVAIPKLTFSQVNHEHNWHARQLRLVDAAIQQANWTTDVDIPDTVMGDYVAPSNK